MDFTREPIIETIVTPKDGCKLVVRSSKSAGQEEYFVDAVEVVSFGQALFFRSLERPKSFLVPVNDYEILEVREARMVLKNIGPDRSIKIGGGREAAVRAPREEKVEISTQPAEEIVPASTEIEAQPAEAVEPKAEVRLDKKRDRRRHYRKRRGGREEAVKEEGGESGIPPLEEAKILIPPPETAEPETPATTPLSSSLLSSLLQPPPTLISETIKSYRENALFKNAFFLSEEEQYKPHDKAHELLSEDDEELAPPLQEPTFEPFEEPAQVETVSQEFIQEEAFFEDTSPVSFEEPPLFQTEEEGIEQKKKPEEASESEASLPLYAEEENTISHKESVADLEEQKFPEDQEHSKTKNKNHHQENLPF